MKRAFPLPRTCDAIEKWAEGDAATKTPATSLSESISSREVTALTEG